jgi:hypothetical protein
LGNHSGGWAGYGATAANKYEDIVGGPGHDNERANKQAAAKQLAETLSAEYQTLMTRGKGGGQGEREEKANEVYQPTAAPEVQAGPLQSMLDALKARYAEYQEAAKSGGGDSWIAKHPDLLAPQATIDAAQAKIDKLYRLNKGSTKPDAAATPSLPKGVKSIQVIQ